MSYRGIPEGNDPQQSAGLFLWRILMGIITTVSATAICWVAYTFDDVRTTVTRDQAAASALTATVLRLERQMSEEISAMQQERGLVAFRLDRLEGAVYRAKGAGDRPIWQMPEKK